MGIIDKLSPGWAARREEANLRRIIAKNKSERLGRAFEAAGKGRRNEGWRATSTDANGELLGALSTLRNRARDMRRNNPYAESAITAIADHVVGHGIVPHALTDSEAVKKNLMAKWARWAESTDCDYDDLRTLYGMQHLCMESVPESGEVLIRAHWVKQKSRDLIPLKLQILESDYIDTHKDNIVSANGDYCIQGVQFNKAGKRIGYWLYEQHPGGNYMRGLTSNLVPADEIIHLFLPKRPGQARGYTWLAPVMQRMRQLDELDDATIEQAKIAACFAAFVHTDGDTTATDTSTPLIERIEPGIIEELTAGKNVTFGNPPTFSGYQPYSWQALHAIGVGLGVPYELLTGDLRGVNFTSGRMGWIRFAKRVDVWQWNMIIPALCDRIWSWFMEAQLLIEKPVMDSVRAEWIPPRKAMLDPGAELSAINTAVRNGQTSWSDSVREAGYSDPRAVAEQIAADNAMFDELGLVLDCDPRKVSAVGQAQQVQPVNPAPTENNSGAGG